MLARIIVSGNGYGHPCNSAEFAIELPLPKHNAEKPVAVVPPQLFHNCSNPAIRHGFPRKQALANPHETSALPGIADARGLQPSRQAITKHLHQHVVLFTEGPHYVVDDHAGKQSPVHAAIVKKATKRQRVNRQLAPGIAGKQNRVFGVFQLGEIGVLIERHSGFPRNGKTAFPNMLPVYLFAVDSKSLRFLPRGRQRVEKGAVGNVLRYDGISKDAHRARAQHIYGHVLVDKSVKVLFPHTVTIEQTDHRVHYVDGFNVRFGMQQVQRSIFPRFRCGSQAQKRSLRGLGRMQGQRRCAHNVHDPFVKMPRKLIHELGDATSRHRRRVDGGALEPQFR